MYATVHLSRIFSDVATRIGDLVEKEHSNETIRNAIQVGWETIFGDITRLDKEAWLKRRSISFVKDQREYRLPDDLYQIIDVVRVGGVDKSYPLRKGSIQDICDDSDSEPVDYYEANGVLGFRLRPSKSVTDAVEILYIPKAPKIEEAWMLEALLFVAALNNPNLEIEDPNISTESTRDLEFSHNPNDKNSTEEGWTGHSGSLCQIIYIMESPETWVESDFIVDFIGSTKYEDFNTVTMETDFNFRIQGLGSVKIVENTDFNSAIDPGSLAMYKHESSPKDLSGDSADKFIVWYHWEVTDIVGSKDWYPKLVFTDEIGDRVFTFRQGSPAIDIRMSESTTGAKFFDRYYHVGFWEITRSHLEESSPGVDWTKIVRMDVGTGSYPAGSIDHTQTVYIDGVFLCRSNYDGDNALVLSGSDGDVYISPISVEGKQSFCIRKDLSEDFPGALQKVLGFMWGSDDTTNTQLDLTGISSIEFSIYLKDDTTTNLFNGKESPDHLVTEMIVSFRTDSDNPQQMFRYSKKPMYGLFRKGWNHFIINFDEFSKVGTPDITDIRTVVVEFFVGTDPIDRPIVADFCIDRFRFSLQRSDGPDGITISYETEEDMRNRWSRPGTMVPLPNYPMIREWLVLESVGRLLDSSTGNFSRHDARLVSVRGGVLRAVERGRDRNYLKKVDRYRSFRTG